MVFVRGLTGRTLNVSVATSTEVASFKTLLEDQSCVPRCHWHLTYEGRPLKDGNQLQCHGISADSTIQLAFRLLGGKGGFGSLLRGAGRAILTDNVDACRDLSGRRIRHANAEKRLAQWAAEAKERELEKIAMKHVQEQQKANKREERAQIDSEAVRREQQEALDRVSAAVIAAQEILAGGTAESGKRKAKMQVAIKPAKRARFFDHELSDSGTDSEDDEEIAMFEKAGQLAAAGSSGLDSTISDQETAHMSAQTDSAAAEAAHGLTESGAAMSADLNLNNVSSTFQAGHAAPSSTQSQASLADQSAVASRQLDSTSPASGRSSLLPNDDTGGVPADAKSQSVPAAETNAAIAPHVDVETSVKAGEIDSVKMASRVIQQQEPIDIASFDNAKQLESIGMDTLKAELQRHGMKCGGTVSERAARLFLLKGKTAKDIDRKHLAKQ